MRFRWPAAALLLIGAVVGIFAEVVFQGKVLFFGDLSLYFLPQLSFERELLLQGRLPLWNPYLFCGQPFIGNPQTWPLYPAAAGLLFGEEARVNAWSSVLHVALLALGTLGFLRHRGLGVAPATLGALSFACGGAVLSKAQFPNMLQAMTWLPWLLWSVDRLIAHLHPGRVVVVALVAAMALLAAHAQIAMMQFYVVLAWVGLRLFQRPWQRPLVALVAAGALGVGLAACQLVPVVEHARASVRPELTLAHANRFYLPWQELALLVAPCAWGNPATASPWRGPGNFWEPCCYIGLVPVVLVVVGLARFRCLGGEARFWLGVALVGLWLALGRGGGLYTLAFRFLPGVKQFHDPARFLYVGTFGLAVSAAHVLALLPPKWARWGPLLVVVALVDLIPFVRTLNPTVRTAALARGRTRLAARLAGAERVFHTEPYRPWKRWVSYRSYETVGSEADVEAFIASGTPNLPLWVDVRQAGGYEPVVRRDIDQVLRALGPLPQAPARLDPGQVALLERLGVGLVLGYDPEQQQVTERRLPAPLPVFTPTVIRETRTPGWSGAPAEGIFRAVPAGGENRYDPTAWRLGVFLSLGSACILGALLTSMMRSRAWLT